jgi:hypothetical protein
VRERPISSVPKAALLLLGLALCLQIGWHFGQPPLRAEAQDLTQPPSLSALRIASFGEPIALAKLLMLDLQAFDNQPGIQLPFRKLDYAKVEAWLARILELDPPAQYPLLMAGSVYGSYGDKARQRQMLEFVYQRFFDDPNRRWPWLAQAAITAKHGLKDLPLALKYARAIRLHATGPAVPHWTQQMEVFILEDMNELASAKTLLAGLLQSGQITDPHELNFLAERLKQMSEEKP